MSEKHYFLDKKENITWIYRALWILGALLIGAELVIHRHEKLALAEFFGFYGIYGFIGCVILVVVAKVLRNFVMRQEDYYD